MVDLSKVSQAVQKFVDEVKASEGMKKKIDTQGEYNKLADYLAGNGKELNTAEKEFIQGLMIEYTNTEKQAKAAEAEKAFMESVTDLTKDVAKDVAKLMGNKKQVDTEAEANELVRYLKENTDLKPSDRKYVENILIESGYGDLLVDRVGALEARADKSDTVNKALARGLYNNTVHDMQQDEKIADGVKVDNAQNQVLKDILTHDAKQDDLIAEGRARDEAQDAKIAEGQTRDEAQDKAIKDGEKHDKSQDRVIVGGIVHDMVQDHVIDEGIKHDKKQDARIHKVKNDLKEHEESFFHGSVSWLE